MGVLAFLAMGGFEFRETMAGTYRRGHEERPMKFTVTARAKDIVQHLMDRRAELVGHVDMEGFATQQALIGELTIDPLIRGRIGYEFSFSADDGKRYRFSGEKTIHLFKPVQSMTVLPGAILDERSTEVATATLHFDPRHLPSFLASFRPIL